MDTTTITAKLLGLRPIMFDRYPGDNNTKLEPLEMMYTDVSKSCYVIPMLNVYSMLCAWNTRSVAKFFHGKEGKKVATHLMAFCAIDGDIDEGQNSVIRDENGNPYVINDDRIQVHSHVARTKQETPNPKNRPVIPKPWNLTINFTLQENGGLKIPTLKRMVEQGGVLGLGTFRPIYGRYYVEWID